MKTVTTLEELLPLVQGITKRDEFCLVVIKHVPANLKTPLARAARDALGLPWPNNSLSTGLSPGQHTEKHRARNRAAMAIWRELPENKARQRALLALPETKMRMKAQKAAWYAIPENKERTRAAMADWYKKPENRENKKAATVAWRAANPNYWSEYFRDRRQSDPAFRVSQNLRARLYEAVKSSQSTKAATTMELTGCTLPELIAHLESQFTDGMSWQNQGEWHIDHIKPCASFDLTDPAQQRACFHFTNLQPLWAADNQSKGDRLDWAAE